jgi:hypothetical protein
MDDPTDRALAISAAVGLFLCFVGGVVSVCRDNRVRTTRLKESRSDPDLENLQDLVADSIPSHK